MAVGDFSHQHVLIQWGGKLPGNETWSCSIRCAEQTTVGAIGTQVPPQAEVNQWLNSSIKDAVLAYHTSMSNPLSSYARLSFVKANRIGINGRYMDQGTNQYVFADIPGSIANAPVPNQIALAISLTTGYTRGPAHRGRYYLPLPTAPTDGISGRIGDGNANSYRDSAKTFLEAIADVPGIDAPNSLTPVVMSRQGQTRQAAYRVVTGVEVGEVLDTQRRRRRSIVENYKGVALDLGVN